MRQTIRGAVALAVALAGMAALSGAPASAHTSPEYFFIGSAPATSEFIGHEHSLNRVSLRNESPQDKFFCVGAWNSADRWVNDACPLLGANQVGERFFSNQFLRGAIKIGGSAASARAREDF